MAAHSGQIMKRENTMSYKTILVHVDQSKHAAQRIRIAAQLALSENAHLIGTAMTGISHYIYEGGMVDPHYPALTAQLDTLRTQACQALEEFETMARNLGVPSFEKRLMEEEAGVGLCLQARYCDLVVIGQADPDETSPSVRADFPEYVVMNCGRPVLLLPSAGHFDQIGNNVLVAWNASMEATRAVTGAVPLLQKAKQVSVAVFNPEDEANVHGAQPGADIALYLTRHNIEVNVMQQTTGIDVGNALLSMAADLSADLIVMGGYGHSRFREILLGGATRTLLTSMTAPVLMSH
jgi:nucleotide-binding universal stress UspA family protein